MRGEDLGAFVDEATGSPLIRIDEDLGGGYVRLRASEADRRQARQDIRSSEDIVLELLRNSRDAGARLICIATCRTGGMREIAVVDDGRGIPTAMWQRVFEPRVTSRLDSFHADQWGVHGRGMALFSIASNTVEHRVASSGPGLGTAIRVVSDTAALPEKADQSTVPRLLEGEGGGTVMRGPRNINRVVAEFTLGQRGGCLVYLGSPSRVVATLVAYGSRVLSRVERAFAADPDAYPLCLRPALAATPEELSDVAGTLGMSVSARNARRVLDGEVEPLEPFVESIGRTGGGATRHAVTAAPARRRVRMTAGDLRAFADGVKAAYGGIAGGYYLDADIEPAVRVGRDGLHVFVPFAEQEGDAR